MTRQPQFCFIAPTSYLDLVSTSDNTKHLVLAHLVDVDTVYANHYKSLAERGDYIMMDNSAYELHEPFTPSKLMELAKRCGATCIVLPDYPFASAEKTITAAKEFGGKFKDAGFDTFFVPQSVVGEQSEWIDCYCWGSEYADVDILGLSILGIPNALRGISPTFARVVMVKMLQGMNIYSSKRHHALGLNSGPALEIPSLVSLDAIDSIDSSGPVWSGLLGVEYSTNTDSYQSTSKIKLPVDFSIARTKDAATIKRIQHNIHLTKQLFTEQETLPWYAVE